MIKNLSEIQILKNEIISLKKLLILSNEKLPYPCPKCGRGRSLMTTLKAKGSDKMGKFMHDCIDENGNDYLCEEQKELKQGQKSLLIDNLVG